MVKVVFNGDLISQYVKMIGSNDAGNVEKWQEISFQDENNVSISYLRQVHLNCCLKS